MIACQLMCLQSHHSRSILCSAASEHLKQTHCLAQSLQHLSGMRLACWLVDKILLHLSPACLSHLRSYTYPLPTPHSGCSEFPPVRSLLCSTSPALPPGGPFHPGGTDSDQPQGHVCCDAVLTVLPGLELTTLLGGPFSTAPYRHTHQLVPCGQGVAVHKHYWLNT